MKMNRTAMASVAAVFCALVPIAQAQTNHYVWKDSPSPSPPYTNWAMAAHTIQDAIEASAAGGVIWVTNGIYDAGGRTNYPSGSGLTNRVAINKAVTVRSVNGPGETVIKGARDPATTNGPAAVRCVYMSGGAKLSGFTLTNGATLALANDHGSGGAVFAANTGVVISNCLVTGNTAFNIGGGAYMWYGEILVSDCRFAGNRAGAHGGAIGSFTIGSSHQLAVSNCVVVGNSAASNGGGVYHAAVVRDSTVAWNSAGNAGGGVYRSSGDPCRIYNSIICGNSALISDSGARGCTLYHCEIVYNGAPNALAGCALRNCLVAGNEGAGAIWPYAVENCTIVGNTTGVSKGGIGVAATNSIIYHNAINVEGYAVGDTFFYSCLFPLPGGMGSMTNNPLLIDSGAGYGTNHVSGNYRLTRGSPCIDKGAYFGWLDDPADPHGRNFDLDGGARIRHKAVDMGAYELRVKRGTTFSVD